MKNFNVKNYKSILITFMLILLGVYLIWFMVNHFAISGADNVSTDQLIYQQVSLHHPTTVSEEFLPEPEPSRGYPPSSMEKIAESEILVLYFHPGTSEIAVTDKRNGTVWYSNPPGREEDTIADPYNKGRLGSQLWLHYYNNKGQSNQYDNWNESIKEGQFEWSQIDDGVRIDYTIGNLANAIILPYRISKERFEALLAKVTDEVDIKEMKLRFRFIEEEQRYEQWSNTIMSAKIKLAEIFKEQGYTEEDLQLDNAENEIETQSGMIFQLPIEYTLEYDQLVVTVPMEELVKPDSTTLHKISVLPFFGAGHVNDQGYMLVPDGSGALIDFNNGKSGDARLKLSMYGNDSSRVNTGLGANAEATRLPVFGIKRNNAAFLAILDQGESIASIEADVSGTLNEYNYTFTSFEVKAMDEVTLQAGSSANTVPVFEQHEYQDDLSIRYAFLEEENADYAGMANYYKSLLFPQSESNSHVKEGPVPFYLSLTGAISKRDTFLGIPYQAVKPLTTFSQAVDIIDAMKRAGIENIQLRYIGWMEGGMKHSWPLNVAIEDKLGGKDGFITLQDELMKRDVKLFPDVLLQQIQRNSLSFRPGDHTSRAIDRSMVKTYPTLLVTMLEEKNKTPTYVLSPRLLPYTVDRFLESVQELGISAVSLGDLGDDLHSDYREKNGLTREEAKGVISTQSSKIKKQGFELMMKQTNGYAIPYAKHIIDVSMENSGFYITDRSIPFYQMVIRGHVEYAGKPINLTDLQGDQAQLLKMLEYGASPHFQWSYALSEAVKDTDFEIMFALHYGDWLEEAANMYSIINEEMSRVRGSSIIDHQILTEGVAKTQFANGLYIVVNYNDQTSLVDGHSIEPLGYIWGGVKQ